MGNMLRAASYLVAIVVVTFWHGGRTIGAGLLGVRYRPNGIYDRASRGWGRWLLAATGLPVRVFHRERIPVGLPVVYVANHVSLVDIWALLQELPGSVRFVFKKEMLNIPVLGQALKAARHISIDRKNQAKAFAAYDEAAEAIREGVSAVVFAEGTRSLDGMLKPFKKGPFVLAISAGVPIVPVYIGGTYAIMPRGAMVPRGGTVTLCVGEPIPTTGFDADARDLLADQARAVIGRLAEEDAARRMGLGA